MSVSAVHYVIIGIEIDDPDDDFFDKYEDDISTTRDTGELIILHDGMNGRYTIVGEVLARSDEEGGFDLVAFGTNDITKRFISVEKRLKEHFGLNPELCELDRIQLHIVTHYH